GAVPFAEDEVHPAAVQEVLQMARRAGMIDEDWVADGRAADPIGKDNYDENIEETADVIADMVTDASDDYYLDPQRTQPLHLEVRCEAADLGPRVARIAGESGVIVFPSSGCDGLKAKREMAERALARDKPTVILQIGDRDDYGDHIFMSTAEDVI